MATDNHVTLTGNVTREPELRFTPSGKAVASFGMAVNRRTKNAHGDWDEETSFFDVTAWDQMAENCAESLPKGARVVVDGRLEQQTWEDKTSGDPRSKVVVIADEIGASLRWANVEITRNERRDPQHQQQGDPGPREPINSDDEPF